MQQTCGQRSVMSVGGKRRALAFYFSVRTCYMFLISKCTRWSDLGLCMTSGLAKRVPLRIAAFRVLNVFGRKIRQNSPLRSGIFFASPEVMHRPRSHSPLHFDKGNIWQMSTVKQNAYARRLRPIDMLKCWPQVCRVKITFRLLQANRFVSTRTNSMKRLVHRDLLRIRVLLRNIQPHLKH